MNNPNNPGHTFLDYVEQDPDPEDIRQNPDGSYFLPIEVVETYLDELATWGTENFHYSIIDDCVYAYITLQIHGTPFCINRIGCCNFKISEFEPNRDVLATAKSLCVKNAATDLGTRFGRYLNSDRPHPNHIAEDIGKTPIKPKPDKAILKTWNTAKQSGNESLVKSLENLYDFTDA